MAASRVRRWFARLLLATVAALLPLGAMEGMLRLMYPGSVDALNNASFTRVSMRPGQTTELIPGAVNPHFMGAGVRVNALGFRGAELDAPKPEGRFRLLAVGDSVTFGFGVPEEAGFVSLLADGLKAKGKDVDVVNHGLPGAGLPYYLHSIRRYCEPLDADAMIVSVVLNDIVEYKPEESLDVPVPGSRANADPAAWSRFTRGSYALTAGFKQLKSLLYAVGVLDLKDSPGYRFVVLETDPAAAARAWEASLAVLDLTVEAASACGVPLGVVVFPLEVQLSEAALASYREGIGVPLAATALDMAPQLVLSEWAASRGVPLIDLRPAFVKDEPGALFLRDAYVNLDPVHPSVLGHRRTADQLEPALVAAGLLP